MVGNKYVMTDPLIEFIPQGSTTPINIGIYGRNAELARQVDDIDATGYGDVSRVHLASKLDVNYSLDVMYDDNHVIEDTLVPGDFGTLNVYPFGNVSGKRKRSLTCYVGPANIAEPYDDVANGSVTFMNTSQAGLATSTVP